MKLSRLSPEDQAEFFRRRALRNQGSFRTLSQLGLSVLGLLALGLPLSLAPRLLALLSICSLLAWLRRLPRHIAPHTLDRHICLHATLVLLITLLLAYDLEAGYFLLLPGLHQLLLLTSFLLVSSRRVFWLAACPPLLGLCLSWGGIGRELAALQGLSLAAGLVMAWLAASLNEASARREFLLERRLQVEANTDLLTGILNRRALQQVAEEEVARSLRYGQPLSLLLLDLDRFKSLNDRFGHDMGDRALQLSASSFRDSLRSSDRVARWGGEEFLVLLPSTGLAEASLLAQRLRRNIEELTLPSGVEPVRWTVSVGVAQLEPGQGWIELLARADKALYRAKEEGRNRVVAAEASAGAEASAWVQEGGKA